MVRSIQFNLMTQKGCQLKGATYDHQEDGLLTSMKLFTLHDHLRLALGSGGV